MKISELTYQVVKNVIYLEDAGFTYKAFIDGDYNDDQDYSNSINNAMAPINEAIHRLSDRNKIAYQIVALGIVGDGLVDITNLGVKVKKIKAMFYMDDGKYLSVGFREFGTGFVLVQKVLRKPLYIQFIEDIPQLSVQTGENYDEETDIDLSTKGISETMCSYIIEYAQGKLQEQIAPELANMHITRAEQYFDDLEEQQTAFTQQVVTAKYRI